MLIKINGGDFWDPNNWEQSDHESRIYGTDDLSIFTVVDDIDYSWAVQHRWSVHTVSAGIRYGVDRPRKSFYLRRNVSKFYDSDGEPYESPITGKLVRNRKRIQYNLFLHAAIMARKGDPRPALNSVIDHADRDTMNCRRENIRWFSPEQNANNRLKHGPRKNLRFGRGGDGMDVIDEVLRESGYD